MKSSRIILIALLGIYLLQVLTIVICKWQPLSARTLPASSVRAELRKDIFPIHVVPLLGLVLLIYPENYTIDFFSHGQKKSVMIDLKRDLPLGELRASELRSGEIVIWRETTRAEIVLFSK